MKKISIFLLGFIFLGCESTPKKIVEQKPCQEIRAAFDIGSNVTKLKVAQVEVCEKRRILQVLLEQTEKINFEDDLAKSSRKELSAKIEMEAIETIRKMKHKAADLGATRFFAVATAGLRDARNGLNFIPRFSKESGVDILVLNQKEEAELSFQSGLVAEEVHRGLDPAEKKSDETLDSKLIVWNIGGSTQEISFLNATKQVAGFNRNVGSIIFRNQVVSKIRPGRHTPNPIGKKNKARVLELAHAEVANFSYEYKLQSPQTSTVVGIGGAHLGISKRLGKTSYGAGDLEAAIDKWIDKTDQQVGGHYADTEVSNLILALSFMQELGIEKVDVLDANLTDGLLAGRD